MTLESIISKIIKGLLTPAVPLLIGVAVVIFLVGLVRYLQSGFGVSKTVSEARDLMVWGIIAIAAMVSIWGLVAIVRGTFFGANPVMTPPLPYKPTNFNTGPTNTNCDIEKDPNCPNY